MLKHGAERQVQWQQRREADRARAVANRTHELASFLVRELDQPELQAQWNGRLTWHDACHGYRELGLKEEDYSAYLDTRRFGSQPHSGFGVGFERLDLHATFVRPSRDRRAHLVTGRGPHFSFLLIVYFTLA